MKTGAPESRTAEIDKLSTGNAPKSSALKGGIDLRRRSADVGIKSPRVSINELTKDNPDWLLKEMYRDQMVSYENYYAPLVASLEDEVNSTELVDDAQRRAASLDADTQGAQNRAIERMGASFTPAQMRQMERSRKQKVSVGESVTVNTARKNQQAIREAATNDLMATASSLQTGSTDALAQVSANKFKRDQAYEAANSAYMTNVLSTVGTVAGSFFGPMGAAAGGAIGAAAGSYMS